MIYQKFFIFICLFCGNLLHSFEEKTGLQFYKETDHFRAYCMERDVSSAETMLRDLEQYWTTWNQNLFSVPFSSKLKLNIFPDIQAYHLKILGDSSAPDWSVCNWDKENTISLVSPKNPGPMHTEESIMKCGRLCLGWFLTNQKYGDRLPFWLAIGISYYEVKIYSKELVYRTLLNQDNAIKVPPLSQLEARRDFPDRPDLIASYVLTEFLIDHCGWNKALAVFDDYSSFENILGFSKEEFRKRCAKSLQEERVSFAGTK